MVWLLSIGGALVALFALFGLFLLWGILHLRQSKHQAATEIRWIELADLAPLANECIEVFHRKLGVRLDLNDCDDTAQKLDDAFRDRYRLKEAFARDDFYWYFVKPVGACLGELLRRHAKHEWRKQAGDPPSMRVVLKDGHSEVFPFEKVIKHAQVGDPGDLVAYLEFARTLDLVAEERQR
jgi:hypothetical protein